AGPTRDGADLLRGTCVPSSDHASEGFRPLAGAPSPQPEPVRGPISWSETLARRGLTVDQAEAARRRSPLRGARRLRPGVARAGVEERRPVHGGRPRLAGLPRPVGGRPREAGPEGGPLAAKLKRHLTGPRWRALLRPPGRPGATPAHAGVRRP